MSAFGLLTITDVECLKAAMLELGNRFPTGNINVVELGIWDGQTAKGLYSVAQDLGFADRMRYYGMDLNATPVPVPNGKKIQGDSLHSWWQVPNDIHLLFIDANHAMNNVLLDWLLYASRIVPKGFIALHDTLPTCRFRDYQGYGNPERPENYISVFRALCMLGAPEINVPFGNSFELFISDADMSLNVSGVSVFEKTRDAAREAFQSSPLPEVNWKKDFESKIVKNGTSQEYVATKSSHRALQQLALFYKLATQQALSHLVEFGTGESFDALISSGVFSSATIVDTTYPELGDYAIPIKVIQKNTLELVPSDLAADARYALFHIDAGKTYKEVWSDLVYSRFFARVIVVSGANQYDDVWSAVQDFVSAHVGSIGKWYFVDSECGHIVLELR